MPDEGGQDRGLRVRLIQARGIPLDAAFGCAPGEMMALVGPSGSGKTTILRAIAGLYRPQGGRITCNGTTWLDADRGISLSPQKRRVGLVFQDYALFPHLSALHNVTAALQGLARDRRRARAEELLDLVNLAGLEDRRPAELSGGQRQRVALARALARDPAVLLLDEPLAAVDQVTRRKLQRELALLRGRLQVPLVLVTHDLGEAAALADRMCVLHRGRTLQIGPPHEVLTRPDSALVARLIDIDNIFEATVLRRDEPHGTTWIRWRGYQLEVDERTTVAPGVAVTWVVPQSHIVMHRRDRPSLGERENPIQGTVGELAVMGETTFVALSVDGDRECRLRFTVSSHAARRNDLREGADVRVSLLADGIHLLPSDAAEEDDITKS